MGVMLGLIISSHHNSLASAHSNNSLIPTQPTPLSRLPVHRSLLWVFLQANPKKEKEKSSLSCRPVAVVLSFHSSHALSHFRTVFIHTSSQLTI